MALLTVCLEIKWPDVAKIPGELGFLKLASFKGPETPLRLVNASIVSIGFVFLHFDPVPRLTWRRMRTYGAGSQSLYLNCVSLMH